MTKRKAATETFARLPQVDRVLREPALIKLAEQVRHEIIVELVREELERYRRSINRAEPAENAAPEGGAELSPEIVAEKVARSAQELLKGGVRRVINGTGVILNTNLGRAPL